MKKILAILVACAFIVSCQWWHETFSSPEDCAVWYCEQIAEAEKDGDIKKAEQLSADFEEWCKGLDKEDQAAAGLAAFAWISANDGFDEDDFDFDEDDFDFDEDDYDYDEDDYDDYDFDEDDYDEAYW